MSEVEVKEENVLLTEQEVWSVIDFARGFNNLSYLSPDLINRRMQELSLLPEFASESKLQEYLKSPLDNEKNLRHFGQALEIISSPYKRLLHYLANMLAWDITYTPTNLVEGKEFSTPKYKKDLTAFENFLMKFDYRQEFPIVMKELLRNDAYFCCPRDAGTKIILQELPADYCKITGRWENGFLFSFDMYYFMQAGVDIDMFPSFFRKKYSEIWGSANTTDYHPHASPLNRASSSWVYWVDVPVDVGWVFKMQPEITTRLPYFTPLFPDLVLQPLMRSLQKNINMSTASRMILGEVPMLNQQQKTTVKDSIAISPALLGQFMALVKSAISEAVKVASAPLENMKAVSFPAENEMYDLFLRTALASSGVNTNLIFSSNIKPNAIETQLSLNVDEQMMFALYPQFDAFVSYYGNGFTKQYKFATRYEGTQFFTNRNQRKEEVLALLDKGIVLPQKIAAAHGMTPWEMRKMMEEAKANNFVDDLTPPQMVLMEKYAPEPAVGAGVPAKGKPLGGAKEGRPTKSDDKLTDGGEGTRARADNVGRGGKK